MDELKELRQLMKNETFEEYGFTPDMRQNILQEINSDKETKPRYRKFTLAPILSFVFIAACLSLFMYMGGTQMGLIEGGNAGKQDLYKTKIAALELPESVRIPSKIPFDVADVSLMEMYPAGEGISGPLKLMIKGAEGQRILVDYSPGAQFIDQTDDSLPEAIREKSVEIQAVKVNGKIGNFHKAGYESFLSWQAGDAVITLSYHQGGWDKMLGKEELISVAQSFVNN